MKKILIVCVFVLGLTGCGIRKIPTALNQVEASWAEVVNQYQRRSDLIPNLVATVEGAKNFEKDTLTAVVQARAAATNTNVSFDKLNAQTMEQFQRAQDSLSSTLSRLMVVVEKYPELKATENFLALQSQIEGAENRIAIARNRFIESVKVYNTFLSVPPESWFNSAFYHYEKKPQFVVANLEQIEKAPQVKFQ
jgi:LemA protein